jgi:sugar lactone lactonase YvrE
VFDYYRPAGLTGRRPFVEVPVEADLPDGLTVDAEVGVWIVVNRGGAVRRYTGAGILDEVVEMAARKVTARTFGGTRLDELSITTSREDLEPGDDPLAGSLFHVVPGVRGQPVREFAG